MGPIKDRHDGFLADIKSMVVAGMVVLVAEQEEEECEQRSVPLLRKEVTAELGISRVTPVYCDAVAAQLTKITKNFRERETKFEPLDMRRTKRTMRGSFRESCRGFCL